MRREFRDLASPEEVRTAIADLDLSREAERVPLEDARGRVLAERIDAEIDVPGFDRSAMDGYAVRARDTFGADRGSPVTFDLVGAVHAGESPAVSVGRGEAVETSTGAVMPAGADAVVIVERTAESDGEVEVRDAVTPGENVMTAGADVAAGARALGPGTQLTPREIGLLAALGADSIPVRGRPRVAVLSTGDELVRPGEPIDHAGGQIYDVNASTIATAVSEAGGEPVRYPTVGDDRAAMAEVLEDAAEECELVLTSGSTSASTVDVIYRVIDERGELLIHGVAVKPGKPTIVGRFDGTSYVGLPGYPVSALSVFRTFVAPAIREAAGLNAPRTATVDGRMAARRRHDEGRLHLLPVGLVEAGSELLVYPVSKGSGATTSLVEADGVLRLEPETEYVAANEPVTVDLFSPDVRPPRLLGMGEDDPALSRLLDWIDRPRYLPVGSREGRRRLRDGLPDVAVLSGSVEPPASAEAVGGWSRGWGLAVASENPEGIDGIADLVDRDLSLWNRQAGSGLRASLDASCSTLAEERGVDLEAVTGSISGFDRGAPGFESPARRVASGDADAGLALRVTAEHLGLGFVPLGVEPVRVVANPERLEKPGVAALIAALDEVERVTGELPGYGPLEDGDDASG